jgi:hypothetical protein
MTSSDFDLSRQPAAAVIADAALPPAQPPGQLRADFPESQDADRLTPQPGQTLPARPVVREGVLVRAAARSPVFAGQRSGRERDRLHLPQPLGQGQHLQHQVFCDVDDAGLRPGDDADAARLRCSPVDVVRQGAEPHDELQPRRGRQHLRIDDARALADEEVGVYELSYELGALGLPEHDDGQLRRRVVQRGLLVMQAALGDEQGAV